MPLRHRAAPQRADPRDLMPARHHRAADEIGAN
jgi:hypothetical protein